MNRPPSVLLAWATLALLAATAQAAPSKPTISWSPCYRDVCPCECGTLQVPLDYDHPTGATISIAVRRLPSSSHERDFSRPSTAARRISTSGTPKRS